jgi:hypothetical protein
MTPVQCLARIAALIPPPRFPLQRLSGVFAPRRGSRLYFPHPRFPLQRLSGVFAPRSPLRAAVVLSAPVARAGVTPTTRRPRTKTKRRTKTKEDTDSPLVAEAEGTLPGRTRESESESERVVPSRPRTSLGDGVVKAEGSRMVWAELLRRTSLVDVLACPCGGRRAIVADISEHDVVVALLAHLKLPTEAPPIARARSPAFEGGVSGPRQTPRHRRQGRGVPRGGAGARVEGSAAWFFRRQREGELRSGRLGLQDRPSLA